MKTTSWEIILAGLLFIGVSIFLIESNSNSPDSGQNKVNSDSLGISFNGENIHVFQLKSLKNLENLQNPENLEKLKNLQNLENLKNLTNILPMEIRAEFEKEIDEIIREMDQESLEVNFDVESKTLTVDSESIKNQQGWTAKSPGVYHYAKSFDSAQNNKTNLTLPFGSVEVKGNQSGRKNLIIEASGKIPSLNDLRSQLATEFNIDEESTTVKLIPKTNKSDDQNIQIQSKLEVPREMQLDIHTMAGHIVSENVIGVQVYKTDGGHITLNNLSGNIEAQTGGGHIEIKESDGEVSLFSKGGNIRVQEFEGELNLQSGGGSLQIIEHKGGVSASTNGGNIEFRIATLDGPVNTQTGAGSITIWINKDANTELNLKGSNVEIDSELNFNGTLQTGSATGTIGTGTYMITAKTNYGTVSVKAIK